MKTKEKIAISIDKSLLDEIDSFIDGSNISSRSQAIEVLVRKALKQSPLTTAVILIHQKELKYLVKEFNGLTLMQHHISFLLRNGIKRLFLVTKDGQFIEDIKKEIGKDIKIEVLNEKKQEGTASALKLLKGKIENDFIVINGDTFNDFDLRRMIQKHKQSGKVATIGLITSKKASKYGGILISGDEIIGIKDKDDSKDIFIINAGIYVFKPTIFKYISREKSLERDVFPKLVKEKQINGYFTHGFYIHAPEFGS